MRKGKLGHIVRIGKGGRLTIPKKFREAVNIKVGDMVAVRWSKEGDSKLSVVFTPVEIVPR